MILALKVTLISPGFKKKEKKKCLTTKAIKKKKSKVVSCSSLSFHLSIVLGERSGARMQFSCGFNWSLVGRSVCVCV